MGRVDKAVAAIILGAVAQSAIAADDDIARRQGTDFSTSVGLELLYDSNLYLQEDNETDAIAFVLRPGADASYSWGSNEIYARYAGELAEYDVTSEDDYFDNYFALGYDIDLTSRHHFKGEAALYKDHTPFGLDRTENTPREDRELDQFDVNVLRGEYMFGADNAKFNVGMYGEYRDREYKANRSETFFLNRTTGIVGVRGIYNLSRRTLFLMDIEGREIEFEEASPGFSRRDATEQRVLLGVRWYATGKTTGTVRVGHMERDQEADERKDFSGIDWDITVAWSPTKRATITFESERTTRESFEEIVDFINTQSFGVEWKHRWTNRFDTKVGIATFNADFDGLPRADLKGGTREDDLHRFELIGTYLLNRHHSLEFGYEFKQRDTNLPNLDYDRNIIRLGFLARY